METLAQDIHAAFVGVSNECEVYVPVPSWDHLNDFTKRFFVLLAERLGEKYTIVDKTRSQMLVSKDLNTDWTVETKEFTENQDCYSWLVKTNGL